jgi:membrane protein DedA with SNARE-associated domain
MVFLVGLESLGVPLPGEVALVRAGAFAALGRLSISAVVATPVTAAVIGDSAAIGWDGTAALDCYGATGPSFTSKNRISNGACFWARHGPKAVFIGRFVALLRTLGRRSGRDGLDAVPPVHAL